MGLIAAGDLPPLLACPRCRQPLEREAGRYRCSGEACALCAKPFAEVAQWPVLVDFSASILVEERVCSSGAASHVARVGAGGFRRWLRDLLFPPNAVAPRNVARMVA